MGSENQFTSIPWDLLPRRKTKAIGRPGLEQARRSDLPGTVKISAFGTEVSLYAPEYEFLRSDSIWRLREIYEPALAANPLPAQGVALDIGAGFGSFCIPFALAYPDWKIWCFEPDPKSFAALRENITSFQIKNLVAVNCAVGGELEASKAEKITEALANEDPDKVRKACPKRRYRAAREQPGYIDGCNYPDTSFKSVSFPSLPPNLLAIIGPDLVKITAPQSEAEILEGLKDVQVGCIIGEIWATIPSGLIYSKPGKNVTWLPVAGAPDLALRKSDSIEGCWQGLDVVVAMYNTREWIVDCVESLISRGSENINVLVIDDGSTDGCGDLVKEHFADCANVIVHRKLNGGCASARNYGRMMSDASHIAFVDADDLADPDLFPELLELSRYSGAEVVQGGYDLLYQEENGDVSFVQSSEDADPNIATLRTMPFHDTEMIRVPASLLMVGQPTIWRRVYRRDFLDNKKVWFPEHIRAFDDQIFQMLTLQYAGNVPMLKKVKLHYRQHAGQDIKQGDERSFYSLEMFRLMTRRALQEGWNDFTPMIRSYINTVNWTHDGLRSDLKPIFLKASAELWVYMQKSFGPDAFQQIPNDAFKASDFAYYARIVQRKLAALDFSSSFAWLDSIHMHAPVVKAAYSSMRRHSVEKSGS